MKRIIAALVLIGGLMSPGPSCAETQLASPSTDHGQRQHDMLVSPVVESGVGGGIIVTLDFGDGGSIADQATKGNVVVHGLLTTEADVEKAHNLIKQEGLYGKVSCDWYNGKDLPYVDNLVNVLLCESTTQVPEPELMRVIAPGGVLMVKTPGGWDKAVKPYPAGMDEWNQFLHGADNNGVSLDDVGPPQRLRWHDTPEYGRSKAFSPSFTNMVSADGVLMTIEDRATTEDINAPSQYCLVARDAFNGIELWKRPMNEEWVGWLGGSIKSISTQQQRCLAAIGKTVYVCTGFGGPVTALDSRTGAAKQVYQLTEQAAEFLIEGNILYGIKGVPYKVGKSHLAGNVELYALDLDTGTIIWSKPIAPVRVKTLHLMASPGFLNDSPQHRTYWTVDRDLRYGGATGKFNSGPAGDTIAFDGKLFYEVRGYPPGRNLPGRGRGLDPLDLYSVYSGSYGGMTKTEDKTVIPAMGLWEQRWNTPTPFAGHAIVASKNTVMTAGVPMLKGYAVEDTNASYAGEKGGIAWLLDATDGHKLQELRFAAPPVWDGIAIAHDHTFAGPPAVSFVGAVNSDIENGKIKEDAPPAQLYDLKSDVSQTQNLQDEDFEVVKALSSLLAGYAPPAANLGPRHRNPRVPGNPATKTPAMPRTRSQIDGQCTIIHFPQGLDIAAGQTLQVQQVLVE